MDVKKLFEDFVSHVNNMTYEDVRNSISNAVEHSSDETKNFQLSEKKAEICPEQLLWSSYHDDSTEDMQTH